MEHWRRYGFNAPFQVVLPMLFFRVSDGFTKFTQILAKIDPPESFMGSKSAQNLMLMPNMLSDYVGYNQILCISGLLWVYFGEQ